VLGIRSKHVWTLNQGEPVCPFILLVFCHLFAYCVHDFAHPFLIEEHALVAWTELALLGLPRLGEKEKFTLFTYHLGSLVRAACRSYSLRTLDQRKL